MSEGGCPEHAPETDETARARAYLIETATPGYTMTRREKHFRKVPREDALQSAGLGGLEGRGSLVLCRSKRTCSSAPISSVGVALYLSSDGSVFAAECCRGAEPP